MGKGRGQGGRNGYPESQIILSKRYAITYLKDGASVPSDGKRRAVMIGEIDSWTWDIRVLDRGYILDRFQTVLHEDVHALTYELNLTALATPDMDDVVDRMAAGTVDMLVRNRWVGETWREKKGEPEMVWPVVAGRKYEVIWVEDEAKVDPYEDQPCVSWSSPVLKIVRLYKTPVVDNLLFTLVRECLTCLTWELRQAEVWKGKEEERSLLVSGLADLLVVNEWVDVPAMLGQFHCWKGQIQE